MRREAMKQAVFAKKIFDNIPGQGIDCAHNLVTGYCRGVKILNFFGLLGVRRENAGVNGDASAKGGDRSVDQVIGSNLLGYCSHVRGHSLVAGSLHGRLHLSPANDPGPDLGPQSAAKHVPDTFGQILFVRWRIEMKRQDRDSLSCLLGRQPGRDEQAGNSRSDKEQDMFR